MLAVVCCRGRMQRRIRQGTPSGSEWRSRCRARMRSSASPSSGPATPPPRPRAQPGRAPTSTLPPLHPPSRPLHAPLPQVQHSALLPAQNFVCDRSAVAGRFCEARCVAQLFAGSISCDLSLVEWERARLGISCIECFCWVT